MEQLLGKTRSTVAHFPAGGKRGDRVRFGWSRHDGCPSPQMMINLLSFSFLYASVWKQVERFQNSDVLCLRLISGLSPSPYDCGDTELRWLNYMPRGIKRLQQYECGVSLKGPMLKLGPQGLRGNELLMRWSLVKGRGVKSRGRGCP